MIQFNSERNKPDERMYGTMKKIILGIAAEYDPFHNGHAKHLAMARAQIQPDFVYTVLSGCFKQRGELAMLSPFDRAACAVAGGADAVFLLPTVWTVRDAEHYAMGAVSLLAGLGATHLAFGAERAELTMMERAAQALEEPAPAFREALRKHLAEGIGYPRAMSLALAGEYPETEGLLDRPNCLLAVCYLRAIRRMKLSVIPVAIPRKGNYHAAEIDPENPSASAIRSALGRGDYGQAFSALPPESRKRIREAFLDGLIPVRRTEDSLLIARLRSMLPDEAAALPDVSEGIGDLILKKAKAVNTRTELLNAVSGRRYPRARISRICAWAMMGKNAEEIGRTPLPDETLLLSMRANPEMTARWRDIGIRIASGLRELPSDPAWNIWTQCAGLPADWPYRQRMILQKTY